MVEERPHRILAHVGSESNGMAVHCVEERAGIACGGVAYVAAFCVGDNELVGVVFAYIGHGIRQRLPSFRAVAFVESGIGLVCHAIGGCGIDYGFVEGQDCCRRICVGTKRSGHACGIGVEAYAQEAAFAENVFY